MALINITLTDGSLWQVGPGNREVGPEEISTILKLPVTDVRNDKYYWFKYPGTYRNGKKFAKTAIRLSYFKNDVTNQYRIAYGVLGYYNIDDPIEEPSEWMSSGDTYIKEKPQIVDLVPFILKDGSAYGDVLIFWVINGTTGSNNNEVFTAILDWIVDLSQDPGTPSDPYSPGGVSKPGDLPPGTFDENSDAIPDSPLPTLSAANTGFTRIYNPSLAQVQQLAQYLWTDESVIQTIWNKIKQYFEDPMQAIIGFNLVPVTVPNGGTEEFKLMFVPTGVQMTVAANQFVDVDCGTVSLERYYGSALDQSPYTKVSCFLPFIGTVQLDTDEVMGTTLQVKYRVDIVSGSCVAKIFVDGNVLYQYSGHCAINIPFSSADFSTYVSAAISVAKLGAGLGVAAASGIPPITSGMPPEQQTNQTVTTTRTEANTVRNPITGRQITTDTRTSVESVERPSTTTKVSYGYLGPANIANTVGDVMGSKPNVEHSGSFSGNTGYLGVRRPFLIIQRPNMCLPENYQQLNGYPAMITMKLSDCKGFTQVQQVQLTGIPATNPEQGEIMGLLKSGVFF